MEVKEGWKEGEKKMARPLLDLYYETEPCCDYPTVVKVAMDDGSIQTYVLQNKTDYQFRTVMESLEKLTVGYQYRGKHRKSRVHKCKL